MIVAVQTGMSPGAVRGKGTRTMSRILETEIRKLENKMLSLSALVGENVHKAVKACQLRDVDLAREVIAADSDVDRMEVELEEDCLKVLALHQPVAVDLRFIVAILKINNDLERIGDCAAKIAQRAKTLASCSEAEHPFDLGTCIVGDRNEG